MNVFAFIAKPATLVFLIFANFTPLTAQTDSIYRLPAGTRISLKLDAEINSTVSSVNDTFTAVLTKPVSVRDTVVLPAGTVVEGRVSSVSRAAGGGRSGKLDVVFDWLRLAEGTRRNIDGVLITKIRAESSQAFNALSILGGTAAGAAVGGAAKSGVGALIGAGIGAGIGSGIALFRKGKEARIRKGEEFEIELMKEVVLPVRDY